MPATTLYNVEDKLSLANKVMEMGIYGHLVITPEIHRLAIERNGTSNSLDQIKIMFKMLKNVAKQLYMVERGGE
uniref:Uncharacterized protein n=1 Tax=Timema douglasi TaxID=61478 RepID=A0A7R8VYA9_TIMDO|nr:unnamed protein product [Timema douglasi]